MECYRCHEIGWVVDLLGSESGFGGPGVVGGRSSGRVSEKGGGGG